MLLGLPLQNFTILLVFAGVDICTGLLKTYVFNGGRSITSKRFFVGIISKLMILIIPILLAWAGKGIGMDLIFLAKGALSALILSELYSIIGNIYSVITKKEQKEFDAIAFILGKIQTTIIHLIKDDYDNKK